MRADALRIEWSSRIRRPVLKPCVSGRSRELAFAAIFPSGDTAIRFLVSRHRPDLQRVRQIVGGFEPRARERASENLVYLEVFRT